MRKPENFTNVDGIFAKAAARNRITSLASEKSKPVGAVKPIDWEAIDTAERKAEIDE